MPSTYAHYKFGKDVFKELPKELVKEINPYMPLYKIGLHGPDLLFYYKPLETNVINQEGAWIHDRTGSVFFEKARAITRKNGQKQVRLAYLYGFICHFVLDSMCHGYVDEKIAESGIGHMEIEIEFDRFLLEEDGKDPLKQDLTKHICVNEDYAKVIAPIFIGVTPKEIKRALSSMKRYSSFLMKPNKFKRFFVYSILKLSGHFEKMKELLVSEIPNPKCMDSNQKLKSLYDEAIAIAVELIIEYYESIDKESLLSEKYQITFGGQREKEANYAV